MLVFVSEFLLTCHLEFPNDSDVVSNYKVHLSQVHQFALKSKIFNLKRLKTERFQANGSLAVLNEFFQSFSASN